jgi:FlaA1/EpsC-like NDP-sugar epimerase
MQPPLVLLPIPSLSRSRCRRIVDEVQEVGLPLLQVPSLEEIAFGRTRIDALHPVAIEELLGRDAVPPDASLLGTGAGSLLGTELWPQFNALQAAIGRQDVNVALARLERLVPEWQRLSRRLAGHLHGGAS